MNETYDKLIDIIAVDIKLAIELIKGQDIDVIDFTEYMFNHSPYNTIKINNLDVQRSIITDGMLYVYIHEGVHFYPAQLFEEINKYLNKL